VPLIVKLPGNKNANAVVERNVSILDVAPTILSQLDIPAPEDMEGEDLFNPKSEERVFYFEAYKGVVDSQRGEVFHLKVSPIRYGMLKGNMKLIYDKGYEAYDVKEDRFESQNIYKNPDSEMAVLSGMLTEFMSNVKDFIEYSKKYFKQRSKLTREEIEKLKSLGYIKK
jgi:arylsulfatase A-like enzyme